MIVLGLDPSLTGFGWAVHDTTKPVGPERCVQRGRFETPSSWEFVDRYIYMRESLRDLVRRVQPDRVGIEFPLFHDLWSEGMYGLFLFSCEALKAEQQDVVFINISQVKAWAKELIERPSGWTMSKPDMIEAAKDHTGGGGRWNHNEADAYLVAAIAGRFWLVFTGELSEDDLTKSEKRIITRVHTYSRGKKAGKTERTGAIHREDDRFFLWGSRGSPDACQEEDEVQGG